MNFRRILLVFSLMVMPFSALCEAREAAATTDADSELPADIMTSVEPATTPSKKPVESKANSSAKAPAKGSTEKTKVSPAKTASTKAGQGAGRAKAAEVAVSKAVSPEEQVLQAIDKRYQGAKSVAMNVEKTVVSSLTELEKKSKGHLVLSKGKMRMEIAEPDKSVVVIDGKTIWVANYPAAEFKDAAVEVLKGSLTTAKGVSQGFVGLLTRGGILKEFKVTGTQKDGTGRSLYFLQPLKDSAEFKRAQMTLSADSKEIAELRYWDSNGNETRMAFSNVVFDKQVPATTFQFTPPPNAAVTIL